MLTGTNEWAGTTENIQFGCSYDCKYCFAKAESPRNKKIAISPWHLPILKLKQEDKKFGRRSKLTMFPSTHDITPDNLDICVAFLRRLLEAGNKVLVVTKPDPTCVFKMCEEFKNFKDQIIFRFTIGSIHNQVLKFWEPGAPGFEDREKSLHYAYYEGYQTSISIEPLLDEHPVSLIVKLKPYVSESIWIGKMKLPQRRCSANGHKDEETVKALEAIKKMQRDSCIRQIFETYKHDPLICWKDSIKKVVGLN